MGLDEMKKKYIAAAWLGAMLLGGCSKESSNPAPTAPKRKDAQGLTAIQHAPANDTASPDYIPLKSGRQLVGLYWAWAKRHVDYDDAANVLYQKYGAEKNDLLRDNMLKDLKPEIDAEIGKARNVQYLVLEPDNASAWIGNYDAEYKHFPLTTMSGASTNYSFNDVPGYTLSFNNPHAFSRFDVADPALVEKVEKLKRNFAIGIKMYVHITGAQPGTNVLEADIQKVELLGPNNVVLGALTSSPR